MRPFLPSLAWGRAEAYGTLTVASTGWLVSGLSPSALVNRLLPAIGALPALLPLPLPLRAFPGYILRLASALLLLGVKPCFSSALAAG